MYKHYKSKNDVLLAALDYYSQFDAEIMQTIEMKALAPKQAIAFCIERLAEYYQNYPDMTAVLNSYEILRHEEGIAQRVNEIFTSRSNLIRHLIEKGIAVGEINLKIDSEIFSGIIIGSFREITLRWRMCNFNFPLKEHILSAHSYIMASC